MLTEPWRIQLLGGLRAAHSTRVITRFRTQKTGMLLAYLACLGEQHPREALLECFWPEEDTDAARVSLRVALNSLRRQLEPPGVPAGAVIRADRLHVQLNPAAYTTDVAQFEAALERARSAQDDAARADLLATAAGLYRGELLPDAAEEWIEPERQRLADAYLGTLRWLIRHLARARELDRALEYAHRAVCVDPLREEGYRTLMRLYAASGRLTAALQQYQELVLQPHLEGKIEVEVRMDEGRWEAA